MKRRADNSRFVAFCHGDIDTGLLLKKENDLTPIPINHEYIHLDIDTCNKKRHILEKRFSETYSTTYAKLIWFEHDIVAHLFLPSFVAKCNATALNAVVASANFTLRDPTRAWIRENGRVANAAETTSKFARIFRLHTRYRKLGIPYSVESRINSVGHFPGARYSVTRAGRNLDREMLMRRMGN